MRTKELRFKKIRECMRLKKRELTISEIHEWIMKVAGMNISRKTIQRDMDELIESRIVIQKEGMPITFSLISEKSYSLELELHEIDIILESLINHERLKDKIILQISA